MIRVTAVLAAVLLLSGCAAQPSKDQVADRFVIELEAATGITEPGFFEDIADGLADDALEGHCHSFGYWAGIKDSPELERAWAATCLMYFEDEMSDGEIERATRILIAAALDD